MKGEEILSCDYCQRIFYFVPPPPKEEEKKSNDAPDAKSAEQADSSEQVQDEASAQ
jgi:hypothetical protein